MQSRAGRHATQWSTGLHPAPLWRLMQLLLATSCVLWIGALAVTAIFVAR
jgi:hypothetical protein